MTRRIIHPELRYQSKLRTFEQSNGPLNRTLNFHPVDSPDRLSVESYIRSKFKEVYAAEIDHFLPMIISLKLGGCFSAAVGMREAEWDHLFVEQYLEIAIEKEISRLSEQTVFRNNIIEIGNLVSTTAGSSQFIFLLLTEILYRIKRDWVVFTATDKVEQLLRKLGFSPHVLTEARADKLGASKCQWGKYYKSRPQVMCLSVLTALSVIRKSRIATEILGFFEEDLRGVGDVWRNAYV